MSDTSEDSSNSDDFEPKQIPEGNTKQGTKRSNTRARAKDKSKVSKPGIQETKDPNNEWEDKREWNVRKPNHKRYMAYSEDSKDNDMQKMMEEFEKMLKVKKLMQNKATFSKSTPIDIAPKPMATTIKSCVVTVPVGTAMEKTEINVVLTDSELNINAFNTVSFDKYVLKIPVSHITTCLGFKGKPLHFFNLIQDSLLQLSKDKEEREHKVSATIVYGHVPNMEHGLTETGIRETLESLGGVKGLESGAGTPVGTSSFEKGLYIIVRLIRYSEDSWVVPLAPVRSSSIDNLKSQILDLQAKVKSFKHDIDGQSFASKTVGHLVDQCLSELKKASEFEYNSIFDDFYSSGLASILSFQAKLHNWPEYETKVQGFKLLHSGVNNKSASNIFQDSAWRNRGEHESKKVTIVTPALKAILRRLDDVMGAREFVGRLESQGIRDEFIGWVRIKYPELLDEKSDSNSTLLFGSAKSDTSSEPSESFKWASAFKSLSPTPKGKDSKDAKSTAEDAKSCPKVAKPKAKDPKDPKDAKDAKEAKNAKPKAKDPKDLKDSKIAKPKVKSNSKLDAKPDNLDSNTSDSRMNQSFFQDSQQDLFCPQGGVFGEPNSKVLDIDNEAFTFSFNNDTSSMGLASGSDVFGADMQPPQQEGVNVFGEFKPSQQAGPLFGGETQQFQPGVFSFGGETQLFGQEPSCTPSWSLNSFGDITQPTQGSDVFGDIQPSPQDGDFRGNTTQTSQQDVSLSGETRASKQAASLFGGETQSSQQDLLKFGGETQSFQPDSSFNFARDSKFFGDETHSSEQGANIFGGT
ncbi:hypothetical protein AAMO2058_001709000 [Amorphochlora amoebiformis]